MQFLSGVLCGMALLFLAVFMADSWTVHEQPSTASPSSVPQSDVIVNWDVAGKRLNTAIESIREGIHDLTK
jgi:hypothetical protein